MGRTCRGGLKPSGNSSHGHFKSRAKQRSQRETVEKVKKGVKGFRAGFGFGRSAGLRGWCSRFRRLVCRPQDQICFQVFRPELGWLKLWVSLHGSLNPYGHGPPRLRMWFKLGYDWLKPRERLNGSCKQSNHYSRIGQLLGCASVN